jgi:hypothetical protein
MLLLKLNFAPRVSGPELDVTWWLRAALVAALGLAVVGGSVSQGVALVMRPGWFADRAGKLGAGVLVAALVLGGAFGLLNDTGLPSFASDPNAPAVEQGYPNCAENSGFPVPRGIEATSGIPRDTFCFAQLQTKLKVGKILRRYTTALKREGWTITYDSRGDENNPLGQLQARRGGDCGSVTAIAGGTVNEFAQITLVIGPPEIACNLGSKLEEQRRQTGP